MTTADPVYVAARRVLLDALAALTKHRDALIVAGAQAVYLHTGDVDLAVAPFTTDGDLAIDPTQLREDPLLETAMREAGFELALQDGHVEPGIWLASTSIGGQQIVVPVDLIVPEGAAGGAGRRGARLGVHGRRAARRAEGLEAVLVDHASMEIAALTPDDARSFTVNVAGPAALLVAKAHKIHDRVVSGRSDRVNDKDAADVFRLMQTTSPATIASTFVELTEDPIAGDPSESAIRYLEQLFGRRGSTGVTLAARALRIAIPQARVEAICTSYISALSSAIGSARQTADDTPRE